MPSGAVELKARTKEFAVRVVRLFRKLPRTAEARVIGRQLLRSATSVGANYRAVCRARSKAEFVAKLGIVVEEADESVFWLELLVDTEICKLAALEPLTKEPRELTAILPHPSALREVGKFDNLEI
ncbi:MAG: four helix bundle protein [Acidobacteriaceae bacterium]